MKYNSDDEKNIDQKSEEKTDLQNGYDSEANGDYFDSENEGEASNDFETPNDAENSEPKTAENVFENNDYLQNKEIEQEFNRYQKNREQRFLRSPLVYGLIGMILSIFVGLGALPAIFGIIKGFRVKRRKYTQTVKWGIVISFVAFFMNLVFFMLYVMFFLITLNKKKIF